MPAPETTARRVLGATLAALGACLLAASASAGGNLPALAVDRAGITVSGLSSGAFMAHQLHVAYSGTFSGAGIIAGGPFACASTSAWPLLATATTVCMDLKDDWFPFVGPPSLGASVEITRRAAAENTIDDTVNLADDRVYLFTGKRDETVPSSVVAVVRDYYREFLDDERIEYVADVDAGHGFATKDEGVACGVTASPYLNDCDYDTAGEVLAQLYEGALQAPATEADPDALQSFDQAPFVPGGDPAEYSLGDTGYFYVPARCTGGVRCRLHVVLHGCRQSASTLGTRFIEGAGYNRWAETNGIVMLYPQARPTSSWWISRTNPRGCWDWWGYTGAGYYEHEAPQMRAIVAMVKRLAATE
jgi:poly(3-hydroxybutyrate) depolymerase